MAEIGRRKEDGGRLARMSEGEKEDQRGMWKMFVGRKREEERKRNGGNKKL